eukprot:10196927-Lingulodinium_polyedra.AAC.1
MLHKDPYLIQYANTVVEERHRWSQSADFQRGNTVRNCTVRITARQSQNLRFAHRLTNATGLVVPNND